MEWVSKASVDVTTTNNDKVWQMLSKYDKLMKYQVQENSRR